MFSTSLPDKFEKMNLIPKTFKKIIKYFLSKVFKKRKMQFVDAKPLCE